MFNFENFISEDFPFCLYCSDSCNFSSSAYKFTSRNKFSCPVCFEEFQKNYVVDELNSISFTCKNIIVNCEIIDDERFWYIKSIQMTKFIRLPDQINFDIIEFKNKETLYNKLHIYLIFL